MSAAKVLTPDEIRAFISRQLRTARMVGQFSQKQCGKVIDVTAQQFQKYETNGSRITAADLFMLASYLHQPLVSFFPFDTGTVNAVEILSTSAETVRAAEAFRDIPDPDTRDRVLDLLQTLSRKEASHV